MNALRWGGGIVLALFLLVPVFGQTPAASPDEQPALTLYWMTPSRTLAGLRGYSDAVVEALARLADSPELLQSAAEAVQAGRQPVSDTWEVTPELREVLGILARSPEVLLLAAAHPEGLELLRSLWSVAPEGVALRLEQLRRGYDQAARQAARAWQQVLEEDPVALGEYRDLLTRFCRAQREVHPGFACIRITDRRYYYACPPNEALVLYAGELDLSPSLSRALAAWWSAHTPQRVDAELERTAEAAVPLPAVEQAVRASVYDWAADERVTMWQPVRAGEVDHALGLVPVMLQPPTDQPAAARLAFAVAEHARLWSPPVPAFALRGPEVESRPAAEAEQPGIVIEEPIPGPQTARRDEVGYGDVWELERPEYAPPRYAGYGYLSTEGRSRRLDLPYSGTSVFEPYGVYYPCAPYYLNGVRLRAGHLGVRAYGSRRSGRIHYGGGRHYGHASVSAGSRRGYRQPQVYISTRNRTGRGQAYGTHASRPVLRHRGVQQYSGPRPRAADRRSLSHIRRSYPAAVHRRDAGATRAFRFGLRARSTALREVYQSRERAIRAQTRPTHSRTGAIRTAPRSSGRAIRPSSRSSSRGSAASGRNRSGGVRRR